MAINADSRSVNPFPDFVIIGSAKTGTTTLAQYLARNPAIAFSRAKEPDILRWKLTEEQARRSFSKMFSDAHPEQLRGEASTCYTGWSHWREEKTESKLVIPPDPPSAAATMMKEIGETAQRLAQFSPRARIIYMVRHPVDRIYSQVHFNTRHAAVPVSFEAALQGDPRYVQVSHYAEILRRYLACFPREQFLITQLDEVATDLPGLLNRVQDFLNVPRVPDLLEEKVFTNEGKHHQLRRTLSNRFRKIPGYPLLRKLAPAALREAAFDLMKRTSSDKGVKAEPMLPETRSRLLKHFTGPNQEFHELTGLDISRWNR